MSNEQFYAVSLETHPQLYQKDHTASLQFSKSMMPFKTKDKMQFHLYWRVPKNVTDKHLTCIKSIVCNHEELNSGNYEINLWSNVDLSENEILMPVKKYINHKIWNPILEIQGTPLEQHSDYFKSVTLDDSLCWLGIDFFKIVSLYKYGGFFVDMDAFILRDMSPLSNLNFVYQWGDTGANPNALNPMGGGPPKEMLCNGAIMRLEKKSETAFKFLEQLRTIRPTPNSVCWGCYLYSQVKDKNLLKLPCAWFNIELLGNHSPTFDCMKYESHPYEPHDGCFAWHWHGAKQWDKIVQRGSKFDLLRTIIDDKFDRVTATRRT